jgi:hypothetical protein
MSLFISAGGGKMIVEFAGDELLLGGFTMQIRVKFKVAMFALIEVRQNNPRKSRKYLKI